MNNQSFNLLSQSEVEYLPRDMEMVPVIDSDYNSSDHDQNENALSNSSEMSWLKPEAVCVQDLTGEQNLSRYSKSFTPTSISSQTPKNSPLLT